MQRRREKRTRRRISCELVMCERTYQGILLNLSARGLFVQTHAMPPNEPNVSVEVRLRLPDPPTILPVDAMVVRAYKVPTNLLSLAGGGLGLVLRNVPDSWSRFLATLDPKKLVKATELDSCPAIRLAADTRCAGCGQSFRLLRSGRCAGCAR